MKETEVKILAYAVQSLECCEKIVQQVRADFFLDCYWLFIHIREVFRESKCLLTDEILKKRQNDIGLDPKIIVTNTLQLAAAQATVVEIKELDIWLNNLRKDHDEYILRNTPSKLIDFIDKNDFNSAKRLCIDVVQKLDVKKTLTTRNNFYTDCSEGLWITYDDHDREIWVEPQPTMRTVVQTFVKYFKEVRKAKFVRDLSLDFGYLILEDHIRISLNSDDPMTREFLNDEINIWTLHNDKGKEFLAALNDYLTKEKHADELIEKRVNEITCEQIYDYTLYEEREKNRDKSVGQLTGFHLLDEATRGFLPGSYVLFYAQTACGKSFILTNIMAHLWRQRKNIVYFTLSDLSAEQIKYRLTACITSIETNKIRFATLNDAEKKRLREFNKAAQEWDGNILILNPAYCTISDIQAKLDTLSWKPDAIFVDYLNVLNSNAIESSNYDYKVQVAYSQALKSLAVSRQTVVYTVAQAVDGANEIATKNVFFDRENLIAFSKAILQPVDYSAFVRYSNDDRALSRIVFFSSKVRDMSRIDWNSRIDFSRAKIDSGSLYDPISTGGKK